MADELRKIKIAMFVWGASLHLEIQQELEDTGQIIENFACKTKEDVVTWSNNISSLEQINSKREKYKNYLVRCAFATHQFASDDLRDNNYSEAIPRLREADYLLRVADSIQDEHTSLTKAKAALAKMGGLARVAADPRQADKAFIFTCWQNWRKNPTNYTYKAEFAKDMISKCEHLKSQKKVEDWCREWEKAHPAS